MRDLFGFDGQSKLYDSFRPNYPAQLVDYVINSVQKLHTNAGDDGASKGTQEACAIDVACGTGLFARQIAPFFKTVIGIDKSESQLEIARQVPNVSQNVSYLYHDGYDLMGVIIRLGMQPPDIKVVTIAQGIHWFDFNRFLVNFQKSLPNNTVFTPIGYCLPHVMNGGTLLDEKMTDNICNKELLREDYDPKFEQFEKFVVDYYNDMMPYFEYDLAIIENCYRDLPFEKYFVHRDFKKISEIQNFDWFKFQQLIFSTSPYRVCRVKNESEISIGIFVDPLVKLLKKVLEVEERLNETNSDDFTSTEDAEILKSIKFDLIIDYFVYILTN
ncbi:putative methyltransferase DDB_G0268948 [Convolutriloba macropyga]|uniref:putative methyltransferase DDB_G0268948 n=1 Tax=Convolutriloba macropyga TaxID=536237 RepID=UPI003F5248B4